MPYSMEKTKGGYRVSSPHGTKAKHTTKAKAEAQMRLLRGWNTAGSPPGRKAPSTPTSTPALMLVPAVKA